MSKLVTCLLFDGQAEAAAHHYVGVFRDGGRQASLGTMVPYGEAGPGAPGTAMVVTFDLDGQDFMGVNGGLKVGFTPAFSVVVQCTSQAEIDHFWDRLVEGGAPSRCGWLTDRFGLSW